MYNGDDRAAMTSIYFLLSQARPDEPFGRGQFSRWHVVDADEAWHFYEGDALELYIMSPDFSSVEKIILGKYEHGTSNPVHIVPAGWWQAAKATGEYSLAGCTVAPGFEFAGFRMLNNAEKEIVSAKFPDLPNLL